jgi:hypothetical protein
MSECQQQTASETRWSDPIRDHITRMLTLLLEDVITLVPSIFVEAPREEEPLITWSGVLWGAIT